MALLRLSVLSGAVGGLALMAVTAASSPSVAAQCCVERPASTSLNTEVIASGLDGPWGMAFLPDGSILVTELPGNIRRIVDGVVSAPFAGVPEVGYVGQGGLLDIALDPDFAETQTIFFSYAQPSDRGRSYGTAVARARIDLDAGRLEDVQTIFTSNEESSGGRHFGSRIRFAPDKTLFVTIGDRGTQMRAQDPFDHAGSVVRINRDGSIPANNPFADGRDALPEIWSIGHRNAQGAAIHPETGELWTLSHGARGGDEVNQPEAGLNYGWPLISYGRNYSGFGFAQGSEAEGLEQPIYYWDPSIAPSGFDFYSHPAPLIPDWQGSLLAGALREQLLSRLILDGDTVVAEEQYFVGTFGRIRDVRTGPDGAVWLLTDGGELIRVTQAVS
ncbi:PQQ-dependent sugar dehydrogenase [Bauldia sp.]|uniref:PQQ-dependent sugar dehydrogenase n=1 Tax=Bauldia sp. TaxID=2575872 RepID=UPI003BAA98E0